MSFGWEEFSSFNRDLAAAVDAGIPLHEAIAQIAGSVRGKRFARALFDLSRDVEAGTPLRDALSGRTGEFPVAYVSMVRAGIEGGNLSDVLRHAAADAEFTGKFRREFLGAALYPLSVIFVCLVFMIVLRIGATSGGFSDWIDLYDQPPEIVRGKGGSGYYDNPAPIRDAMLVAQKHVLLVLFLLTAIAFGLLAAVLLSPRFRTLDRIRWKIILLVPFVSRVVRSGLAARFFSALRGLMAAGIPVPRSLELTRGMLAGTPMENAADRILAVSSDGNSLSDGIGADRLFPPGVAAFLKAGESTGKVLDTLRVLEQMHRERWESGMAFARSFVAPAFEIMAGLAVMAVTLGMLFSYLNLLGGIQATL